MSADQLQAELLELLEEWRQTCGAMGLPFMLVDAVSFAAEADYFERLAATQESGAVA